MVCLYQIHIFVVLWDGATQKPQLLLTLESGHCPLVKLGSSKESNQQNKCENRTDFMSIALTFWPLRIKILSNRLPLPRDNMCCHGYAALDLNRSNGRSYEAVCSSIGWWACIFDRKSTEPSFQKNDACA